MPKPNGSGAVLLLEDNSAPKKSGPSAATKVRQKLEGEKEELQARFTKKNKVNKDRVMTTGRRALNTAETLVTTGIASYGEGRLGERMKIMGRDPRPVGAVVLLGVGFVRSLGGHKDASHEVAVGTGLAASSIASWGRDAGQRAAANAAGASGAQVTPMGTADPRQIPANPDLNLKSAATPPGDEKVEVDAQGNPVKLAGRGDRRRVIEPANRREPARLPPHLQPRHRQAHA